MSWNLEGDVVHGYYMDEFPVVGRVELSRVKYGGGVCHHVVLEKEIVIYGRLRDRVILDHEQVERVSNS